MGIQRYWRSLSGGVLLLWQIGKVALDVGGNADFIIEKSNDPGWLAVVLTGLLDPPGFLTLPAVLVGLGLIWLDARRGQNVRKRKYSSLDQKNVFSLEAAVTKIQLSTGVEKTLFPSRIHLDEQIVGMFIADFVKSLCVSQEVSLFEARSSSWELIQIDEYSLRECSFRENKFLIHKFELVSKTGSRISNLYMIRPDIEIVILKLRLAMPLIKAVPPTKST